MDDASVHTRAAIRPAEPVLGLRILAHPDLERVGALCTPLLEGELSRATPRFPDGPLGTLHVSRTPVALAARGRGVVLHAPPHAKLTLEGAPVVGERVLSKRALDAGVVLTLGRAVALWLGRFEPGAAPHLEGLVGVSAGAAALKRKLAQLAPHATSVLLRGAPGSGKRSIARALHALGSRAAIPLGDRLDDEALYVEELCALDSVQQAALCVRLKRADHAGRVIAACAHEPPHALCALFAEVVQVPSLREHAEDIAPLFVHFVREELQAVGAPARVRCTEEGDPFVPAALIPRLVRAPWPGNARQLREFARAYVRANHAQARIELAPWLAALPGPSRSGRKPGSFRGHI
jgi:two-component system nitrogen regulation response regulator GlnG